MPSIAFRTAPLTFVALVLLSGGSPVQAQPTGGQVIAGSAAIAAGPGNLTVTQTSDRAIINWQDFSIASGDRVRFVQPDATSATLNRVVSGLPSSLLGSLQSNGRVFLVNPNGVLVGAGARIDTGGFVAATLDVADPEFLAGGELHFSGSSNAAINNLGTISALGGDVFLIARQVKNTGAILATGGTAGLAAGTEVLLTTGGPERLLVRASSASGLIDNAGTVAAATAELKAAGGNAYALAINNSGAVRATGTAVRGGQVWLVASGQGGVAMAGSIDASSAEAQGGAVTIRGNRVAIDPGARLDASGATGGGRIQVEGGFQAGGQVTVAGTLDARALAGGDGGFVETSAASVKVTDDARVTTTAADGANGTWLIDPVDFTIAASGGDMTGAAVGTALAGGNFSIQSTSGTAGTRGDVVVNAAVTWTANKLTLKAQNDINFNAALNGSGTASLALEYGQGAVASGNTSTYNVRVAVNLPAGNSFSTLQGSDGVLKSYTVITQIGVEGSATATDLQGMRGNLAGLYALGSNLDAAATSTWNAGAGFVPVGNLATSFTGILDGLGHTVSNLTLNRPGTDYVGLIGSAGSGATVRNLGLVGNSAIGADRVGGLVGHNAGTVRNSSATGTASGTKNVGGLVGSNLGTISDSWATGNVSNVSGTLGFVGGLTGNTGSTGVIRNSWASGNVSGTGPNVGGLVGFATNGVISNTYATGTVSGVNFVGGLVGSGAGPVDNSYATGNVSGTGSYIGGLVGYNYSGITISTSYATGTATGGTIVGGLVGNNAGTVTTAYFNSTNNVRGIGGGTNSGATGLTTAQLRVMANFTGFDLANSGGSTAVWRIYEDNSTPLLRVFLRPLTVTATNATKTYNGVAFSGGNGAAYSVASPNPALSGTLAYGGTAQSAVNAGSYTLTASGLYSVQQGYDLTYVAGTLTVSQANLTLGGTRVYDGTTLFAGSNLTATGVHGETFAVTGAGAAGNLTSKNVQANQLLASVTGLVLGTSGNGGLSGNYSSLSPTGSSVSVTPKTLTYTADTATRVFGANDPAFSGTVTGFVNSETLGTATTGTPVFGTTATGASVAGTYPINGSGLTANGGNYAFVQAAGNATAFTITPAVSRANLVIQASDTTKVYGAALPVFTASYNGFVNGDTAASVTGLQFSTTATIGSNVGTFTITPFGATAPSAYDLIYRAGTLNITPAALVFTVNNASRLYGAANPAFTGAFSGFVNGDQAGSVTGLLFSTPAAAGSSVGTYAVNASGANAANYVITYTPGTLTVNRAPLTVTAGDAEREFGAANPAFSSSFTGLVNGDTAAVVGGLVLLTPAVAESPLGQYAITPAGATAANYTIGFVNGTLRVFAPTVAVGPTPLTVATVGELPALTTDFALVQQGDRLGLVPVGPPGGTSGSVDSRLGLTLTDATGLDRFERDAGRAGTPPAGGLPSANVLNFGDFELVAPLGAGGAGAAQAIDPGLFRESTVNMGGYNIVYQESLAEERRQGGGNTALGSSYREFSDSDNPQLNVVRAKMAREPADSGAGPNPPGAL